MLITEMDHFSHPHHRLKLLPVEAPYNCDGCKELGFAPCYQCEMCPSFHLHEECARASPNIFHKYFKKHELKFYEENPSSRERTCDACGKDIQGFLYQCCCEKYDLHPCCAKLQETLTGHGGITIHLSDKVLKKCLKCGSKKVSKTVKGWSYVSSCGQYCYHVACVKDLIVDNWRMGYFANINEVNNYLALQNFTVPSQQVALQSGESSIVRKAKTFCKYALLCIKLVVSAIFGNPTDLIAVLLEPLLSDR